MIAKKLIRREEMVSSFDDENSKFGKHQKFLSKFLWLKNSLFGIFKNLRFLFVFVIIFFIFLNINYISAVTNCNTHGFCSGTYYNTCNDAYHCSNSCYNCFSYPHVADASCSMYAAGPFVRCSINSCKDSYANADGDWSNGCELKVACGSDSDCNTPGSCQILPGHCINGNTINAQCLYDPAPGTPISDTSTNANNGNVYCAGSVAGRVGQAFDFNGVSSYVSVPNNPSIQPVDKLTISTWVKLDTLPTSPNFRYVMEKSLTNTWSSYFLIIDSDGKIRFSVENQGLQMCPVWKTNSPLSINTWYHVTGVFEKMNGDSSDGKVYINGISVPITFITNGCSGGYNSGFSIGYDSGNLNIGREGGNINSNYFDGIIDEVKIWDYVLNDNEILNEYQNGDSQAASTCNLGEDKIIENLNLQLNCLNTNKVVFGNDLTINWAFSLKNTLPFGIYPVYSHAKDSINAEVFREGGNISLVESASSVNSAPSLLPLTPVSGESFPNQEVNFSYGCSDADGINDLNYCSLFIFSNETYPSIPFVLYYYPEINNLELANETNNSIMAGTCNIGEDKVIENKNSKLNCSKISILTSGTNVSLRIPIAFKEVFAGKTYNIEPFAKDKAQPSHTIYEIKGNWIVKNFVFANYPPTAGSINPSGGEFFINEESIFSSDYSDSNGFTDIASIYLIIDSNISDTQKVLIVYYPSSRKIEIRNDVNNSRVDGNCTIGENKIISNYYTDIKCLNSETSGSGETMNVEWSFIFKEKFIGQRRFFIKATDTNGTSSLWKDVGNISIKKRILSNCTDSDGGKNYTKKGITNGTNSALTDYCINDTTLKEYYCNNSGGVVFVSYKCPGKCSNGACAEIKATTPVTTTPEEDKSEVYGSTEPSTSEEDTTPVKGKTAGQLVLWSIIWIIIVIFCIILIYFIYSLNKKRALRKKLLNKISAPIIRQMPPRYFGPPFRR